MPLKVQVDVDALFAEMEQLYPDPPGYEGSDRPDTTDREAVQQYIAAKLRSRT